MLSYLVQVVSIEYGSMCSSIASTQTVFDMIRYKLQGCTNHHSDNIGLLKRLVLALGWINLDIIALRVLLTKHHARIILCCLVLSNMWQTCEICAPYFSNLPSIVLHAPSAMVWYDLDLSKSLASTSDDHVVTNTTSIWAVRTHWQALYL